jgi:hypothetical protein
MNADGSGQIDVTNHPSFDADPAWSDGSARAERAAYLRRVRGPVP